MKQREKKMEKVKTGYHGDLQFMAVESVPKEAKKLKDGTLHHSSQSSAHDHVVRGDFELYELDKSKYLVAKDAVVSMRAAPDKHRDVPLKDSTWEVTRGRETDHIKNVIQEIAD